MPRPAEFWPSSKVSPGMIAGLMPATAYFEVTVTAGSLRAAVAVMVSGVPLGRLTRVHCISNAHSMVRPVITVESAATMSTAVQAMAALKVAATEIAATIALNMARVVLLGSGRECLFGEDGTACLSIGQTN